MVSSYISLRGLARSVLVLYLIQVGIGARPVYADDCRQADAICRNFIDNTQSPSDDFKAQVCAVPSQLPENTSLVEVNKKVSECLEGAASRYQMVAPNCSAMRSASSSKDSAIAFTVVYGVVAALCTSACICSNVQPACGVAVGLSYACSTATLLAAGAELTTNLILKENADAAVDAMSDVVIPSVGVLMGVGTLIAQATSAQQSAPLMSCVMAGATALQAILKGTSISGYEDTKKSACENLVKQTSSNLGIVGHAELSMDGSADGVRVAGAKAPKSQTGNTGSGGGTDGGSDINFGSLTPEQFASMSSSAASADPRLKEFFKHMRPEDALKAFKNLGPGAVQAASGYMKGSMTDMLSPMLDAAAGQGAGMAKASQEIRDRMKQADAEFQKRLQEHQKKVLAGSAYVGGAKASPAGVKKSALDFGSFGTQPAAAPVVMQFGGAVPAAQNAPDLSWETDDIYHSNFKGSLFQIVSGRLSRTKERVESYEWDSPFNRERQGLPQKSGAEGLRPTGGRTP
jgi:hypothetical protein